MEDAFGYEVVVNWQSRFYVEAIADIAGWRTLESVEKF